jgi:2-oxoglutarate ferredoxin oxidoreductase subunit beta
VKGEAGKEAMPARPIQTKYRSDLKRRVGMVLAGAAGEKINSAATLFARGAALAGLWATQRNDYPVTVKSGHSVAEVILDSRDIGYTGINKPEVMLLLFKEGLGTVRSQLAEMGEDDFVFINADLLPIETRARIIPIDFTQMTGWMTKKEYWAIIGLARILKVLQFYPLEAFREAVAGRHEFAQENLRAVEAGEGMGSGDAGL